MVTTLIAVFGAFSRAQPTSIGFPANSNPKGLEVVQSTNWKWRYPNVLPHAKPDAPPAAANPAGTWETIASLPDGGTRPGTIVIKEENGQLTAAASGEQGDRKMDLIKWEKGILMLERGIERDGRQGKIKVSARESAAGQLTGTWSLTDDGGNELMTGAWEAKKKSTP